MKTQAQTLADRVRDLIDASKYHEAADLALSEAGGSMSMVLSDTKRPAWGDEDPHKGAYHPHWIVRIDGPGGSYTFDFWGSIAAGEATAQAKAWNATKRIPGQSKKKVPQPEQPTAYDILACLQWYEVGTFEDFCSEFGYDTDSRKAEATWIAVADQYRNLCRVFPSQEHRDTLAEIR